MVGPLLSQDSATLVDVPDLLAEAGRRIGAAREREPAGSLAVVEVRVPEAAGPDTTAAVFALVAVCASGLGAWTAFDEDQGHYLLLLPLTRTWIAAEVLGELLQQLAAVEVRCGRHLVRPSVGAGVVALTGHVDPADSVGEIDLALTDAIGLAHRSRVERALRVHGGRGRGTAPPPRGQPALGAATPLPDAVGGAQGLGAARWPTWWWPGSSRCCCTAPCTWCSGWT